MGVPYGIVTSADRSILDVTMYLRDNYFASLTTFNLNYHKNLSGCDSPEFESRTMHLTLIYMTNTVSDRKDHHIRPEIIQFQARVRFSVEFLVARGSNTASLSTHFTTFSVTAWSNSLLTDYVDNPKHQSRF